MSDQADHAAPADALRSAIGHTVARVPRAAPGERAGYVRDAIAGATFDSASHVVVIDGEAFRGIVRLERLLAASADAAMETLLDGDAPVVAPGVDQEIAAWQAVRRGQSALAIVDASNRFVGMIPPQRLLTVLLDEHEEDLSRLGGFTDGAARIRSSSEEPVRRRFGHRIPWLLLGLGGALQSAEFVSRFEHQLRVHLALAFFIPAIVYLADAVGTQTETVVVRALSVGIRVRSMVRSELLTGLSIGAALAVAAGAMVFALWGQAPLAATVGLAVLATCATATMTGMLLPACLDSLGIDPAFGSGPLATIAQDLLSVLIYFGVAALVMG